MIIQAYPPNQPEEQLLSQQGVQQLLQQSPICQPSSASAVVVTAFVIAVYKKEYHKNDKPENCAAFTTAVISKKIKHMSYLHQSKSVIAAVARVAVAVVTATEQKKKYKNKEQYAVIGTKKVTAAVVVSEHKTNTSEKFWVRVKSDSMYNMLKLL